LASAPPTCTSSWRAVSIRAEASPYDVVPSPVTGILAGRPTARSNVAAFMAGLIQDDRLWRAWRFGAPVVMNAQ
jgi:hypothetical protein